MAHLGGSMVAIITPMAPGIDVDNVVDWPRFEKFIDFHVEQGTDGIVAVGTTGESATLSETEHCKLIERVVHYVAGRVTVIAGTGANSTSEAIQLTQCAKDAGADACLLVTPYYNKPTQSGLIAHHAKVAETVSIPQILYNVPGRTACDMLPETVAELAKVDNIVGIKEATGEVERVEVLRKSCGDTFLLLSGDDETGREFMLRGGDGVISVTANVAPRLMSDMCKAALAGDRAGATELDQRLLPLHKALFCESNPIPVKWAAHKMGFADAGIRLPMTWLSEANEQRVADAMSAAGIEI